MKIIHYNHQGKRYGLLDGDVIKPLQCQNLIELITQTTFPVLEESVALGDVEILAPIERPIRNLFCLGKNYKDHALEMAGKTTDAVVVPDQPIYFSKACYRTLPHLGEITGHINVSDAVDYEVELAVIIGKEGKSIPKNQVYDHIFGYTIVNDLSARDLQVKHVQWHRGKSLDDFTPMGPVILHKSSVAYPPDLNIKCYVNEECRQDSQTSNLIFDIDTIIHDLSQGMTLLPGDIILTGTPSGVGMGYNPPKYLKSGDRISCFIEHIGILENRLK